MQRTITYILLILHNYIINNHTNNLLAIIVIMNINANSIRITKHNKKITNSIFINKI